MNTSEIRARYEASLYRAHKALRDSQIIADTQGWEGAASDLSDLGAEVDRLVEDSLAGGRKRSRTPSWRDGLR